MHQFSNQIQFSVIIQHVIVAVLVFLVPSAVRHGHPPPQQKKINCHQSWVYYRDLVVLLIGKQTVVISYKENRVLHNQWPSMQKGEICPHFFKFSTKLFHLHVSYI